MNRRSHSIAKLKCKPALRREFVLRGERWSLWLKLDPAGEPIMAFGRLGHRRALLRWRPLRRVMAESFFIDAFGIQTELLEAAAAARASGVAGVQP